MEGGGEGIRCFQKQYVISGAIQMSMSFGWWIKYYFLTLYSFTNSGIAVEIPIKNRAD